MKSLFKYLLASLVMSFSFVAAHASFVEADTVLSQNLVETYVVKSNYLYSDNANFDYTNSANLIIHNKITMMSDRESSNTTPPQFQMYSTPYSGSVIFGIGYEAPTDSTSQDLNVHLSASGAMGRSIPMNFDAGEYNFRFGKVAEPGVMNVDGKIVCKEEIRVAEVNTNKVNSDEVNTKGITAKEINVEMNNAADYVFDEAYDLKPLDEVEAFVKSNKHLPGVPSASELKENGMNVSEMSNLLLEKVEELTLHLIRLQKEVEQLREENNALKNKR